MGEQLSEANRADLRAFLRSFGQDEFREGSRADYVTAADWTDYVEVELAVLAKIAAKVATLAARSEGLYPDQIAEIANCCTPTNTAGETRDGWVTVPREPTEAMMDAFIPRGGSVGPFDLNRAYRAMIAAAPKPSEKAGEEAPVAWTHEIQMEMLKRSPRQSAAMWGEQNGLINVPLYRRAPSQEAVVSEGKAPTLSEAGEFAEQSDDPIAEMLRKAAAANGRGDTVGAGLFIHAARLAYATKALSSNGAAPC